MDVAGKIAEQYITVKATLGEKWIHQLSEPPFRGYASISRASFVGDTSIPYKPCGLERLK